MNFIKEIKTTAIVSIVIYILVGLFMLIFPSIVSNSICYVVGGTILIFGIVRLVSYFQLEYKNFLTGILLFLSLFAIGLGTYIIFYPEGFISTIPLIVGVVMIIDGIQKIIQISSIKKAGYDNTLGSYIYSFVLIILGIILIRNPFGAIIIVIRIIGLFLIAEAIEEIISMKKYKDFFKSISKEKNKNIRVIDGESINEEDK